MSDFVYVNPEYAKLLEKGNLLDLNYLLKWNEGICVGKHGSRVTWRAELPVDVELSKKGENSRGNSETENRKIVAYIRQEKRIPMREIIEDCQKFRAPLSRAMKTLFATQLLRDLNIDVADLLCVIERRCLNVPRKAVAIQRHVSGRTLYYQLKSFGLPIYSGKNSHVRNQLFYELGVFVKRMHDGKIDWPDFVAKHVIVNYIKRENCDKSRWNFTLIDVERLFVGANADKRNRQLDKFLLSIRAFTKSTDLIRMGRGYLGIESNMPRSVRRNLWRKFFPDSWRRIMRAKSEMRMLKRLPDNIPLQEEELYERINGSVVNMRLKGFLQEANLLGREALFGFERGSKLIKAGIGRRERMRFEIVHDNQRKWFYLKRVRYPKLKNQIDRILCGTVRHSSCWHERYMIKQLSLARIPTPVIVAYSEKMFFCFERASALITEGIIGQSLEKFVPKVFHRGANREELLQRRRWIRQLAELIGRFHKSGFCHRDLYLSHIFIGFRNDGEPVFYLIDLARCFKPYLRKRRWVIKDLSALNYSSPARIISNTDRMRFLRAYLDVPKIDKKNKKLIYDIIKKTKRIERHNRKSPAITVERKI